MKESILMSDSVTYFFLLNTFQKEFCGSAVPAACLSLVMRESPVGEVVYLAPLPSVMIGVS